LNSNGSSASSDNGGIAASGAIVNSQATTDANGAGNIHVAGAAFNSSADTTTAIPTCSGAGLAFGVRSDGHFCVDVLGNVVSG
jgi:hypothetical protein